jgi:chemotaxis protein CheX
MTTSTVNLTGSEQRKSFEALLGLAAREVFSLMLGCELQNSSEAATEIVDVTAMVGLAGSMCGLVTLRCMSKSTAVMASRMLGLDAETGSAEALDAVGEVCNMVAGNFKNKIAGMGNGCKLSVPTVITGENYSLHSKGYDTKIELRMLLEKLPLLIAVEVNA